MLPNILCDKCHSKKASVTLTKIRDGKAVEIHLCQQCASEASPFQKKLMQTQQNLGQILASLLGQKKEHEAAAPIPKDDIHSDQICYGCGLPLTKYKKTLFLGCPKCYDSFEEQLLTDLRRIHGTTWHFKEQKEQAAKEAPITEVDTQEEIEQLEQPSIEDLKIALNKAVDEENYEEAARIRDEIKKRKGSL